MFWTPIFSLCPEIVLPAKKKCALGVNCERGVEMSSPRGGCCSWFSAGNMLR